jgi:biopolymer transport protein TolR
MAFKIDSYQDHPDNVGTSLSEINVIPFVDVVLVLLLIFMLTAPMMYRGIDVDLPRAVRSAEPTEMEERMILTLTKDEEIYLNDERIPLIQLDTKLNSAFKHRKDKTLYLKADRKLSYGFVIESMDRIRRAGIEKLGMVTEPTVEKEK